MNIDKAINKYAIRYQGQSMASMQSTIDLINGKTSKPYKKPAKAKAIVEDTISEQDLPTDADLDYLRSQGVNV